jgi:hypothetical protein
MRLKSTLFFGLSVLFFTTAFAQERYVEEVFTDSEITLTSDVHYATNATIIGLLFDPNVDEFIPERLFLDVYEPDQMIDQETARPVVMVVHGGDGLPRIVNGACWGDKTDTTSVNIARKLARMGYVAVVPNYRLGWNPLTDRQDDFLDGLADAAFRIGQDMKACARFLRKDVAEGGNNYAINPDNIAIWGVASTAGTYSLLAAYINEIEETQTPTYFVTDEMGNIRNIVDINELGDLDGLTVGMLPNGDTTNYINHPGYSSDFQLVVSASGISLDAGVLDPGEPPLIKIGNPRSVVTQFPEGPIQLPTTGEVVAFVQLSQGVITEANNVGLNQAWIDAGLNDPYTLSQRADPNFGSQEGWFPTYGDPDNEYPFVWWDEVNCPVSAGSFDILPGADRDYGLTQIDSMAGYFGARACITFDLGCAGITSSREPVLDANLVQIAPNPTQGALHIRTSQQQPIQELQIYSVTGQLLRSFRVDSDRFQHDGIGLPAGYYQVLVRLEDGIVTKKLIISD